MNNTNIKIDVTSIDEALSIIDNFINKEEEHNNNCTLNLQITINNSNHISNSSQKIDLEKINDIEKTIQQITGWISLYSAHTRQIAIVAEHLSESLLGASKPSCENLTNTSFLH